MRPCGHALEFCDRMAGGIIAWPHGRMAAWLGSIASIKELISGKSGGK